MKFAQTLNEDLCRFLSLRKIVLLHVALFYRTGVLALHGADLMNFRMSPCRAMFIMAVVLYCPRSMNAAEHDSNTTYTIKLRPRNVGETCHVTETIRTSTPTFRDSHGAEFKIEVTTQTHSFAFTEEVQARTPAGDVLTRARRDYTIAEHSIEGQKRPYSFAGKSVLIERQPNRRYAFKLADGGQIQAEETEHFTSAFGSSSLATPHCCLPGKPVKINEVWKFKQTRPGARPGNTPKPTGTGKLTRVYRENGSLHGAFTLQLKSQATPTSPAITIEITFDGCIDGTSTVGKLKSQLAIPFAVPTTRGDIQLQHTVVREMAVRAVK